MNKTRVLIVDDEASLSRLIQLNLEATGRYEVRTESHGARVLETAKAFQPALILLDVIMPDLDGGAVAAQLKADPATQAIPIVFLTAVVSRDEVTERAGLVGGYPFLAKPVSLEALQKCVERHVRA